MRCLAVILAVATVLAGCGTGSPSGTTPGQRLYAADGGYRALLELAVAYSEACHTRPAELQTRCREVVAKLRTIDRRYADLRSRVDDDAPSTAGVVVMEAAIVELRRVLTSAQLAEDGS
jgi:hypothetical protein